jgi:hypothetical protein
MCYFFLQISSNGDVPVPFFNRPLGSNVVEKRRKWGEKTEAAKAAKPIQTANLKYAEHSLTRIA